MASHAVMMRRDPHHPDAPSRIEIDLGAIEHNARVFAGLLSSGIGFRGSGIGKSGDDEPMADPQTRHPKPDTRHPILCGVVKKDAYGLGAVPVAHRLVRAGCAMLAVYSREEVEQLTAGAVTAPILLLSPLRELSRTDGLYRHMVAERLHVSIHDLDQLEAVNEIGRTFGIRVPVHLYLDTGMSRSGLSVQQFHAILGDRPAHLRHVRLAGVYSHLATADTDAGFALEQLGRFEAAVADHADGLPGDMIRHIANSYAALRDRRFHLDMLRPGLGMMGYADTSMRDGPRITGVPPLRPAARWVSAVNHAARYRQWSPVGYGSTVKVRRNSVLGVMPVGYADGYPLALSNKGVVRVMIEGDGEGSEKMAHDAPVLGRVNMDQIVIDLTDLPGVDASGEGDLSRLRGLEVEIYSNDPAAPNALHRLAELAGSHCYELLCRLSPRLPRRHFG